MTRRLQAASSPRSDRREAVPGARNQRAPATVGAGNDGRRPPKLRFGLRLALFGVIAIGIGAAAVNQFADRFGAPAPTDTSAVQVHASMGGFEPGAIAVGAGQALRVEFSSMDGPFHSDGGGWHQFAIDELGVDWRVGPDSSEVFELAAPTTPGVYTWYCDICCGGRENPTMRGTLTVTA